MKIYHIAKPRVPQSRDGGFGLKAMRRGLGSKVLSSGLGV